MRFFSKLATAASLLVISLSLQAQIQTPTWNNAITDVVNSDFNTGTLTFPAINAGSLLAITSPGTGYWHSHGSVATVLLEVQLDNVWTTIYNSGTQVWPDTQITTISTPIVFPAGSVTGVRISMSPGVNQSFHSVNAAMAFVFDGEIVPVPTTSPLGLTALFGSLMLLGLMVLQRRIRKDQS